MMITLEIFTMVMKQIFTRVVMIMITGISTMTWILASVVHSPLVEGVVLGITLKGAFLNYEAHLGVNYLVWHFIQEVWIIPHFYSQASSFH